MGKKVIYALALMLVLCTGRAEAGLKVLEGEHTVVYDIVNPRGVAFIPDYSNESFDQKVLTQDEFSKRVQVTTKLHPLTSKAPFPVPANAVPQSLAQYLAPEKDRQANDPALIRLVTELTAGSHTAADAANNILSWLADNLTFDTSITVPSDALSALKHRKAYCVGYSNLAVAMLRTAGIPARVAHGYLPPGYEWGFSKDYWGVKVNDGGFHAYLELYYPDTGWVFSDAEHSHNFVDPFHIILRLDGMDLPGKYDGGYLDVDKATFFTIFSEVDKTMLADELALPKEKRLGRRIDAAQHSALITGRVTDQEGTKVQRGTLVLWKDGKGTPTPFTDGRYSAAVPVPGKYRVELRGAGFAKTAQELVIEPAQVYRINMTLRPGGVIKGKVADANGIPVPDGDVFYREGTMSYGVPVELNGTYRIEGLAPGQYSLSYTRGGKKVSRVGQTVAGKETVINFVAP